MLKRRFPHYSALAFKPRAHLAFLAANYFQDTQPNGPLIPADLFNRAQAQRTIVYLATDPDRYLPLLYKYWPLGDIFAIEKPLARAPSTDARNRSNTASDKAREITVFAERYGGMFDKVFLGVDHYLGKYIVTVLKYIRKVPAFAEVINDANTIVFQFLETDIADPLIHPYFAKTGIIADMMPHVLALLMKMFGPDLNICREKVIRWRMKSYNDMCKTANIPDRKETHAEIVLRMSEQRHADRNVIVRIGKGVKYEDRKVAFVDSRGHIIEMQLPFTVDGAERSGCVLLKTPGGTIELRAPDVSPAELSAGPWDNAWYNVIRNLMSLKLGEPPDIFLGIREAEKIVRIIEELRR